MTSRTVPERLQAVRHTLRSCGVRSSKRRSYFLGYSDVTVRRSQTSTGSPPQHTRSVGKERAVGGCGGRMPARSSRRPSPPVPASPPPSSSSAACATPTCRAASPGSPPSVPSGSASSFSLGSPWSCSSAPGAELGPAPLRLGVSSGEQVFVDPQNRDAVLVPRRGTQIPSGLRTTTAYTVDVQLANGLCYAVRIRFSRFERLHAELLRELPGVPLPPLPQKRGP